LKHTRDAEKYQGGETAVLIGIMMKPRERLDPRKETADYVGKNVVA
jgi:hypothetical protein